ncbi:MAG TPA: FAD-dependent oxidoreductase, partial [Candidatus Ozemobacteraceae bacterium]|nr:FAD-dependent oxidoreductase [Candidatus Ozemobacteraceae bacterium]
MKRHFDPEIVVCGGGPAGGTAALYAARIGRRVTLLTGNPYGSLIAANREIDNFPGTPGLDGVRFIEQLHRQCADAGVTLVQQHAVSLELENRVKILRTDAARTFETPVVIVAIGTRPLRPPIPGLDTFWGRGVSVCAWCDGALHRGRSVAVYGGGNTAYISVRLLSRLAKDVHLLLPKRAGTAFQAVQSQVAEATNVHVHQEVEVLALEGQTHLASVHLKTAGQPLTLGIDGFFLALGQKPHTDFLRPLVDLDAAGYIKADSNGSTSCPGVY